MSTYEPLQEMRTTGPAYLDNGFVTWGLVESGEYVAALYESYAADQECADGDTYLTRPTQTPVATWRANDYTIREFGDSLKSLVDYCHTAQTLAEDLWSRDLHAVIGES